MTGKELPAAPGARLVQPEDALPARLAPQPTPGADDREGGESGRLISLTVITGGEARTICRYCGRTLDVVEIPHFRDRQLAQ